MKIKRFLIAAISLTVLLAVAFFAYTAVYYHADTASLASLESSGAVKVSAEDYGYLFDGPSSGDVLIFYPGGKVEYTAYAPLCRAAAEAGIDVCLVRMPFNLAFFGADKAGEITDCYSYDNIIIGGHSLGGVFAANYAAENSENIDGLVLLAAYTVKDIPSGIKTVSVYGSDDGVLDKEQYEKNHGHFHAGTAEYIIDGGNHSQFGSYGFQRGDGEAEISPEEQIKETVGIITDNFLNTNPED